MANYCNKNISVSTTLITIGKLHVHRTFEVSHLSLFMCQYVFLTHIWQAGNQSGGRTWWQAVWVWVWMVRKQSCYHSQNFDELLSRFVFCCDPFGDDLSPFANPNSKSGSAFGGQVNKAESVMFRSFARFCNAFFNRLGDKNFISASFWLFEFSLGTYMGHDWDSTNS